MLLACPSCATAFRVAADAVAASGRAVRCSRCATVWTATPADLLPEPQATPPAPPPPRATAKAPEPAMSAADLAEWGLDAPPDAPAPDDPAPAAPSAPALPAEPALPAPTPAGPPPTIEAPPLVPEMEAPPTAAATAEADAAEATGAYPDIETIARRRLRTQPKRQKACPSTIALRAGCAMFAAILVAALGMRAEIVRARPGFAGLYAAIGLPVNLRGLELHEVKAVREVREGVPMLAIEGYVFNPGPKAIDVPKLRLAVLAATGRELYAWTAAPSEPILSSGEVAVFRSRLASPPQEGREILVRFVHRRDLAAQAK